MPEENIAAAQDDPRVFTLAEAAAAIGVDATTVARRLHAAGVQTPKGGRFNLAQLAAAFAVRVSDARAVADARLEKIKAETELMRMQIAEKSRELIPMTEVRDILEAVLGFTRGALDSAPATLAAKVNPVAPVSAREAIKDWRDGVLDHIRKSMTSAFHELPQPTTEHKTVTNT